LAEARSSGAINLACHIVAACGLNIEAVVFVGMKVIFSMMSFTVVYRALSINNIQLIGNGRYTCIDGRKYHGQWQNGKRSGLGEMILCPVVERGHYHRRFIGGLCGLYRPMKYSGTWSDDQRFGKGKLEMMDGMIIEGEFVCGLPEGCVRLSFSDGTWRNALFSKGQREREITGDRSRGPGR